MRRGRTSFCGGLAVAVALVPAVARGAGSEAPAPAQAGPLRMADAIKLALARNEIAKIADDQIIVADAAVEKARVAFLQVDRDDANSER